MGWALTRGYRKRLQEQDEDGTNVFWLTVASPHFESYQTKIRLLKWLVQAGIETHIFDTVRCLEIV